MSVYASGWWLKKSKDDDWMRNKKMEKCLREWNGKKERKKITLWERE